MSKKYTADLKLRRWLIKGPLGSERGVVTNSGFAVVVATISK
jgi:hypothetical protein